VRFERRFQVVASSINWSRNDAHIARTHLSQRLRRFRTQTRNPGVGTGRLKFADCFSTCRNKCVDERSPTRVQDVIERMTYRGAVAELIAEQCLDVTATAQHAQD